ncbi:methyltransferase domain-containing protein [candidate division KSB3 bacterium]|uniref:Methyltransferase domain-containing protein n=1 Tax=candidate division KSB3 bacterium TaxID=2044937 RepID=A0A9D5Q5L5_9BACT|nr:methyltransferase domain-containing protein [candidate division KSB3 bacterium]MBD3324001.1 methyltransferase domain-containing protein [candidate division KSB3 bacterium]
MMNKITRSLRSQLYKLVICVSAQIPLKTFQHLLIEMTTRRAYSLPSDEGLRFLFRLDAALYPVKGELAISYGGGIHTKHRHIGYHDFFVSRIYSEEQVLDLGCGNGALAYDIAERVGSHVFAIDLNPESIRQACCLYSHPRIEYQVGDILRDLPHKHFDVIILSNVLEHLANRIEFLQDVQAAIQPSHMLIRVPLFERDWQVPLKKELGVEWRLDATHETEYTLECFAAEIAKAGLHITYQKVRWGEIWAEVVSHAA